MEQRAQGADDFVGQVQEWTERIGELHEASDACFREAGELIERVLEPCARYLGLLAERESLVLEVRDSQELRLARERAPDVASEWEQASPAPEGGRVPVDVGAFIEFILELALDPGNDGHRGGAVVVESRYADPSLPRPRGEPERKRIEVDAGSRKYARHLAKLIPDCRDRVATLSIKVSERYASNATVFGNLQAGPSFAGIETLPDVSEAPSARLPVGTTE